MGEIVNLNKVRKAKAREEAKAQAERNRLLHGRTRAEKDGARKQSDKAARELDGKKIED